MIDYQEELEQYQERIDELAKEKRYAELRDLSLIHISEPTRPY